MEYKPKIRKMLLQTKNDNIQEKKNIAVKRYAGLDGLRGCILISMILYHGTWDMVYIFGKQWAWFESSVAHVWQQSICWGFILLSGFCWSFSKKPWKRGLITFVAGAIVTIVTKLFMPESIIIFGVLTFLGSSMLLMIFLDKGLRRCNPVLGVLLFFVLFVITRNVNYGYLGFEQWNWVALPKELYANWFTTYLGFIQPGFFSTDYFGIFPWVFLFVTGFFLQGVFRKWDWLEPFTDSRCKWLEWLGRHSLIIYMLHQPVVYGLLYVFYIF